MQSIQLYNINAIQLLLATTEPLFGDPIQISTLYIVLIFAAKPTLGH